MTDDTMEITEQDVAVVEKPELAFSPGDRVAWSHEYATQFPPDVTVYADAAVANGGRVGTVTGVANDEGTYFDVDLDPAEEGGEVEQTTLTADELVRVRERD